MLINLRMLRSCALYVDQFKNVNSAVIFFSNSAVHIFVEMMVKIDRLVCYFYCLSGLGMLGLESQSQPH